MARVRSRVNALGRLLDECPGPLFVCDDQKRIVYCNTACADLVGLSCDELIGQTVRYESSGPGSSPAGAAAGLCPPPAAWNGQLLTGKITLHAGKGQLLERQAVFVPLGEQPIQCVGVLSMLFTRPTVGVLPPQAVGESMELHRTLNHLRHKLLRQFSVGELIGAGAVIDRVQAQVEVAAKAQLRTVVFGPTGSGREHTARWIHQQSAGSENRPLMPIYCPLVDAEIVQSTIRALLVQADDSGGERIPALLLLDVEQLSEEAQSELCGFLTLPGFRMQTIATAGGPLEEAVADGSFSNELAQRLSTMTIRMPSLTERREDIPLLAQFFVESQNAQQEKQLGGFTAEAMDELVGYDWPGNVEQLNEVVTSTCRNAEGPTIDWEDLPSEVRWSAAPERHPRRSEEVISLDQLLTEIEQELIERAMRLAKGNKTRAAELLGINRARLHRRLGDGTS